jgi:hypothetical protein
MDSIGIEVEQLGQRILGRPICCWNSKQRSPFRGHGLDQQYPAVSFDIFRSLLDFGYTEIMVRERLELLGLQRTQT